MKNIDLRMESVTVESKVRKLPVKIPKEMSENFRLPRKVKKRMKSRLGKNAYIYWWNGIKRLMIK